MWAKGDDIHEMLCFITFVGISSYPWDSLALSDLATFLILLGETCLNSYNVRGCCRMLSK
jgi:hypothetical protein